MLLQKVESLYFFLLHSIPLCKSNTVGFLMHADMTAVTTQSNKIALNEVKDNLVLLEPSYGKKQAGFLANPKET